MSRESTAATAAQTTEADGTLLQRKCACGNTAGPVTETCEECQRTGALGLQARLTIGASDDPLEQAADRAADAVLAGRTPPAPGPASPILSRRGQAAPAAADVPASVGSVLSQPGRPLSPADEQFFGQRFHHDFSSVRVHHDHSAARSAADVNAEAYTVGRHVVFGSGRYRPDSGPGRRLLAHELAHVVQQAPTERPVLRRAIFRQGELTVLIDYGDVVNTPEAERADRIVAFVEELTFLPPDAAEEARIRGLPPDAQEWLLFACQLLNDNWEDAVSLDWGAAVNHLIDHAPGARFRPLPDPDDEFVREVLRVSRWSETALTERLPDADVFDQSVAEGVVNPSPRGSVPRLDLRQLNRRLVPALEHFLNEIDPARWTNVGTRSISAFQAIGDIVLQEARQFFAPYADAAAGNLFDLATPWHGANNIFDTNASRPDASTRESYVMNRAEVVGRATATRRAINDAKIFEEVHFDNRRDRDQRALLRIAHFVINRPGMRTRVNRIIRHTGVQFGSGSEAQIGISTRFDADRRNACEDHWRGIGTMCHEVMHALVHPDWMAASGNVGFPQVVREGAAEALAVQLFNDHVLPKQSRDAAFKTTLEAGVSGAPCPAPPQRTMGYGAAGAGAEEIRAQVGDDNFRAAYFLGRPDLAGLT